MTEDDIKRSATIVAHEVAAMFGMTVPLDSDHPVVKRIARSMGAAVALENQNCEGIAQHCGDQQEACGRPGKAEIAWGVAARIRMRRPKHPF